MRLDSSGNLLLNGGSDVRIELGTHGSVGTNDRNHIRGDGDNLKYNCNAGGGHIFEANGGERMRIHTNGSVGINTNTPFSDAELTVGNGGSGNASIAWRRTGSGENDWALSNQGGELKLLGGGDATTIGGLSEKVRFQSGGGISFNGDTAAANALDDYEQGSYTPLSSGPSISITVNEALYTKIGNRVWVDVDIVFAASTSSSQARITLPFAMSANDHYGSGLAGWTDFGDGVKIHVGGATAYLMKMDNTIAGNQHLSFGDMSNKRIIAGFYYETA